MCSARPISSSTVKGLPEVDAFGPEIAESDDRQAFAADRGGGAGVAQDGNAGTLDGGGHEVAIEPVIVIAGRGGVRVRRVERTVGSSDAFEFMASSVSSEKPKGENQHATTIGPSLN